MTDPTGEADRSALRLDFDRRLMLQFRGSTTTSDAGLLPYRELDDALHLTDTAADKLADARTGKNGRHRLAGLLRQSVFGRLAGYEDVNDAERLCRDPAMRWVVGDRAISGSAASASQMGRFETKWLVCCNGRRLGGTLPSQARKSGEYRIKGGIRETHYRSGFEPQFGILARTVPSAGGLASWDGSLFTTSPSVGRRGSLCRGS